MIIFLLMVICVFLSVATGAANREAARLRAWLLWAATMPKGNARSCL